MKTMRRHLAWVSLAAAGALAGCGQGVWLEGDLSQLEMPSQIELKPVGYSPAPVLTSSFNTPNDPFVLTANDSQALKIFQDLNNTLPLPFYSQNALPTKYAALVVGFSAEAINLSQYGKLHIIGRVAGGRIIGGSTSCGTGKTPDNSAAYSNQGFTLKVLKSDGNYSTIQHNSTVASTEEINLDLSSELAASNVVWRLSDGGGSTITGIIVEIHAHYPTDSVNCSMLTLYYLKAFLER